MVGANPDGSSPLARGTREAYQASERVGRLIPARAGNTVADMALYNRA